jgi:hypothetical protein
MLIYLNRCKIANDRQQPGANGSPIMLWPLRHHDEASRQFDRFARIGHPVKYRDGEAHSAHQLKRIAKKLRAAEIAGFQRQKHIAVLAADRA